MRQAVFAIPLLLMMPAGAAFAQASGSYQNTCTNISQNGSTLIARCQGPGGLYDTTLDLDRCGNIGVANNRGRLACGNQRGSASLARGGGDDDGDNQPRRRRYNNDYGQRDYGQGDGGYAARPRYGNPDDGYAQPRRRYYSPDQY